MVIHVCGLGRGAQLQRGPCGAGQCSGFVSPRSIEYSEMHPLSVQLWSICLSQSKDGIRTIAFVPGAVQPCSPSITTRSQHSALRVHAVRLIQPAIILMSHALKLVAWKSLLQQRGNSKSPRCCMLLGPNVVLIMVMSRQPRKRDEVCTDMPADPFLHTAQTGHRLSSDEVQKMSCYAGTHVSKPRADIFL